MDKSFSDEKSRNEQIVEQITPRIKEIADSHIAEALKPKNRGIKFLKDWLAPILTVGFIFLAGSYKTTLENHFINIERKADSVDLTLKHEVDLRKEYYTYNFVDKIDSTSPRYKMLQHFNTGKDIFEYISNENKTVK